MRIKSKEEKKTPLVSQSTTILPPNDDFLTKESDYLNKRSNSHERTAKKNRLLEDDQFSCATSDFSAFDESDQSSILDADTSINEDSNLKEEERDEVPDMDFDDHKLDLLQLNVSNQSPTKKRVNGAIDQSSISMEHDRIKVDLMRAMEDARATMFEVAGQLGKNKVVVQGSQLIGIDEEPSKKKQQP